MLNRNGRLLRSLLIENTKLAWAWAPNGNSPLRKYDPTRKDIGLATYGLRINRLGIVVTIPKTENTYSFVHGATWLPNGKNIVWCCDQGL